MAQNSSTFVSETRDRETWVRPAVEREAVADVSPDQLLATAALVRGVMLAIPVPDDAEARARAMAVNQFQQQLVERSTQQVPRAPWYLRLGSLMRFVFTLGRRR